MVASKPFPAPTLLLMLTILAWGLCLGAGWVFDDYAIFTAQPLTRPLTWLTFRLNELAGGDSPVGFHAVNLLLHLAAVWLARDALSRVLPARAAGIAALVFALHPLQSEAVNYVWARSSLLMTVFCLLSIREWVGGRLWRSVPWCALALSSKEEAVALPLFFALLHVSISRNRAEWRPIAAMFGLALASGFYVLWVASVTPGSQAGAQAQYTPLEYLSSEGLAILRYLGLLLLPLRQTIDPVVPAGWALAWIPVLGLVGISLTRFSGAGPGFWFLAGLVLLLPSSSVFPANDLAAERRMYLPMVAFAALIGLGLQALDKRWVIVMALVLTVWSAWRSWVWQSSERLWREAVTLAPGKVRPRVQLSRSVPPAQALAVLEEAKRIAPGDALVASELGRVHLDGRRYSEALAEFGRALALAPNSPPALSNRGVALLMLKQTEAAKADFERALQLDPCNFEARHNLHRLGFETALPANCK